jgi:GNAT superfamily N-acetyltransferase
VETDYDKAIVEHLVVVVELKGRCIGLLELHVLPDHLLLENIAILPEVQGFGVGPRALSHAEEIACSLQKGALRLYTNKAFTTNLAFYVKHGFSETREEMLPDGGLLVHFEKKVAAFPRNARASGAARHHASKSDHC